MTLATYRTVPFIRVFARKAGHCGRRECRRPFRVNDACYRPLRERARVGIKRCFRLCALCGEACEWKAERVAAKE